MVKWQRAYPKLNVIVSLESHGMAHWQLQNLISIYKSGNVQVAHKSGQLNG